MKAGICTAVLIMATSSAYSQQTLLSEIKPGNLWLSSSYSSSSIDTEVEVQGNSGSSSRDYSQLSIEMVKAFDSGQGITPLLDINLGSITDDEVSSYSFGAQVGAKLILEDNQNFVLFAGFDGAGADKELTSFTTDDFQVSNYKAGMSLGLSPIGFYNESTLTVNLPRELGNTTGGNSVELINSLKITPAYNLVLTGLVGVSLISDIESGSTTTSFGPQFTFGGEAELFLTNTISAALIASKRVGSSDASGFGQQADIDMDTTLVQMSLNARF